MAAVNFEDKANELLSRLDVPTDIKDKYLSEEGKIDDINPHMEKTFVSVKSHENDMGSVKGQMGKNLQLVEQAMSPLFKDLGLELSEEDINSKEKDVDGNFKPKPTHEIVKLQVGKIGEHFIKVKDDSTKDSGEQITNLGTQLDTEKTKVGTLQETIRVKEDKITEMESSHKTEIETFKVQHTLSGLKTSIPFKDDMTSIEKAGFESVVDKKLIFRMETEDDKETMKVFDSDGKPINNEKKTDFLTPEQALLGIADENKLLKVNDGGGGDKKPAKPATPKADNGKGGEEDIEHKGQSRASIAMRLEMEEKQQN